MTLDRAVQAFAGIMVIISLLLAVFDFFIQAGVKFLLGQ